MNVLRIGHRGSKGYVAENTLESINHAILLGVDGIEIDIFKCLSGELVLSHENVAMIRLDKKLSDQKNIKSKMLLQIHDELIFEVPKNNEKIMIKLIKDEMTSVAESDYHSFSTPLTVDINIGDNWGMLH